jgi:hypothetical protein
MRSSSGARAHFDNARESRDEQYVRPHKRNLVDVFVSKEFLDDALKFANELFLALEERGHRVIIAPAGTRYHHVPAEVCQGRDERYGYHGTPGRWKPARPTVLLIGDVTIGLTIFEVSEEVELRYDSRSHKYVRVDAARDEVVRKLRRAVPPAYHDWTTKRWLATGRIGLHAYAVERGIEWRHHWRESKPGELSMKLDGIVRELKRAVPTINELVAQHEREAEEHRRRWEVQRREFERREAERQRAELDARREKEIVDVISNWRMARDVRAYVAEVRAVVKDAGLNLVPDGDGEKELTWALAYADQIDPLMSWRNDIAQVKAVESGQPCPKCGRIHESADDAGKNTPEKVSALDPPAPGGGAGGRSDINSQPEGAQAAGTA